MTAIDDPELTKPSGIACQNCTTAGCGIYATRPQVCRDFICEWRRLAYLDEDWRPDRSGVLITGRILPGEAGEEIRATVLTVFANHDVIFDQGFATVVAIAVDNGREVFLGLPAADFDGVWELPLREFVASGVAAGSLAEVGEGIRMAHARLQRKAQR
ncbi:MAG: hypothetical protein K2X68_05795 [Novosphingobium sp.]|nr:hypothetical protein [Novosphingobium sp.]